MVSDTLRAIAEYSRNVRTEFIHTVQETQVAQQSADTVSYTHLIGGLGTFGCGVLYQIGNKTEHVFVIVDILEWIVAKRCVGIDEVSNNIKMDGATKRSSRL